MVARRRAVAARDTVVDPRCRSASGIDFHRVTFDALLDSARSRDELLHDNRESSTRCARRGMAQDFSWGQAAARYEQLYGSCDDRFTPHDIEAPRVR